MNSPRLPDLPFFPKPQAGQPLLLSAPLASLSNGVLRRIWAELGGCDIYFSEMISADGFLANSPYRFLYMDEAGQGERTVFQLVGAEQDILCSALEGLVQYFDQASQGDGQRHALGFDINMGCSAPEIVRKGAGVGWMNKPDLVLPLLEKMRAIVPAHYSLSVKMRLGEDDDFPRLVDFCRGIQGCGVDFVTLHPRVRKDPWGRPARTNRIPRLARELSVPVLANGDLGSMASTQSFLSAWESECPDFGCTGIMIGRGAVSSPWIFRDIKAAWAKDGLCSTPALDSELLGCIHHDRLALAEEFHKKLEELIPNEFWEGRAKRFYAWYCLPLMFGHRLAAQIQTLPDYQAILPFYRSALEKSPERLVRT